MRRKVFITLSVGILTDRDPHEYGNHLASFLEDILDVENPTSEVEVWCTDAEEAE